MAGSLAALPVHGRVRCCLGSAAVALVKLLCSGFTALILYLKPDSQFVYVTEPWSCTATGGPSTAAHREGQVELFADRNCIDVGNSPP